MHQTVTVRSLSTTQVQLDGRPCAADSWFPGYAWTIAYCGRCFNHLGWRFTLAREGDEEAYIENNGSDDEDDDEDDEEEGSEGDGSSSSGSSYETMSDEEEEEEESEGDNEAPVTVDDIPCEDLAAATMLRDIMQSAMQEEEGGVGPLENRVKEFW